MKLLRDKVLRESYMCSKVCGMISRHELREDHPQQRKSGQWSAETRDNFIVTIIINEDFDPIKICEQLTEDGVILWLIDGLQRCTTTTDFKAGKFRLGRNINPSIIEYQITEKDENGKIINKNIEYDLRGKSYNDLPEKLKEDFDSCPFMAVKQLDCTDEEVGRHMARYNSGAKMVPGQKLVTYMPTKAKKVKELSSHPFFNDCANYSNALDKNGQTEQVVCDSLLFTYMSEKWTRTTKKIATLIEENITDEIFDRCINQMDRLLNIVTPEKGKYFSTKNALLWFRLFNKFSDLGLDDDRFIDFLNDFEELKSKKFKVSKAYTLNKGTNAQKELDLLSFTELDSLGSSKDRGILTDKAYILETLLENYLHNDIEETQSKNKSEENKEVPVIDFVKENVKSDVTEDDIELYRWILEDCIKITSPLYKEENFPSLISVVASSCENNTDKQLPDWFAIYEKNNNTYLRNQADNYLHMKDDFERYIKEKEEVA